MLERKLIFRIKKSGKIEIDALGFTGTTCTDVSKIFEERLGAVMNRDLKSEYHEVPFIETTVEEDL
jgi:hypothetical protein